jgi:acyl transferase domain-containing protein
MKPAKLIAVGRSYAKPGGRPRQIRPKIAFMFTGQGSQYPAMCQELYKAEARFAETIHQVASILDPEMGFP